MTHTHHWIDVRDPDDMIIYYRCLRCDRLKLRENERWTLHTSPKTRHSSA